MSENKNNGSAVTTPEGNQEESKVVPAKAYEEVTRDMHKHKQKAKEYEAQINQLMAQLKAQEEADMRKNEQYKELAERREAEMEQLRTEFSQKSSRFQQAQKRAALKQELGGSVKEEYLTFANLDGIQMDDNGIIDAESLRQVANEFRKQHGQLLPKTPTGEITGHDANISDLNPQVDIGKMTAADLVKHYAKIKQS